MSQNIVMMAKREDPFSRVPKRLLDFPELSMKAKGIMSYLLGKPAGWKLNIKDIQNHCTDGKASIRAGLNELRKAGYAQLVPIRNEKKSKIKEWCWKISDSPIFLDTDFQEVENQDLENEEVENRHHSKKEQQQEGTYKKKELEQEQQLQQQQLQNDDDFLKKIGVQHLKEARKRLAQGKRYEPNGE